MGDPATNWKLEKYNHILVIDCDKSNNYRHVQMLSFKNCGMTDQELHELRLKRKEDRMRTRHLSIIFTQKHPYKFIAKVDSS